MPLHRDTERRAVGAAMVLVGVIVACVGLWLCAAPEAVHWRRTISSVTALAAGALGVQLHRLLP